MKRETTKRTVWYHYWRVPKCSISFISEETERKVCFHAADLAKKTLIHRLKRVLGDSSLKALKKIMKILPISKQY